jgi:hypothetical protein
MLKKLAIYSLTAVMFGASTVAFAHTGVRDKLVEGASSYNAFTIGHGCASVRNSTPLPVRAQGVVFPNATDAVWTALNSDGSPNTNITLGLADVIQEAALPAPKLVQDKNIFIVQRTVKLNGNAHAFHMRGGLLDVDSIGIVPFKITAPKFQANSCAKSLKIRIAIANWCKNGVMNAAAPADKDRRADFWLGKATTKFSDPLVVETIADWTANPAVPPFWPTLTITRDLTNNPLPGTGNNPNTTPCSPAGGYDVAVEPSVNDIDTYLPITDFPLGKK